MTDLPFDRLVARVPLFLFFFGEQLEDCPTLGLVSDGFKKTLEMLHVVAPDKSFRVHPAHYREVPVART